MTERLGQTIKLLPKAELHLHLRGAMPLPVLAELLNRHDLQSSLAGVPESKRVVFESYDNIRPFLVPRQRWPLSAFA